MRRGYRVLTLIMLVIILISSIINISIPYVYGDTVIILTVRNLGDEKVDLNATLYNITDINILNLVDTLLTIADLLEKYNRTTSNNLREVAGLILLGHYDEAIIKYKELLPQILDLVNNLQDVDPELVSEVLSNLPLDLENAIAGNPPETSISLPSSSFSNIKTPIPNIGSLSSNVGAVSNVSIPYLDIILPFILILAVIFIVYYYRKYIMEKLSPVLSKYANKVLVRIKLGGKPSDPRGIVIYNYRRFLFILEKSRGLIKKKSETPREFIKKIDKDIYHLSQELTDLFEKAKYSRKEITSSEAARSDEIISSIEGVYGWGRSY